MSITALIFTTTIALLSGLIAADDLAPALSDKQ